MSCNSCAADPRPPLMEDHGAVSYNNMTLTWESAYAIALRLKRLHPGVDFEDVTLLQIYNWTLELEDFEDDPALCNDEILASIYQEWYEELIDARD